DRVHRDTAGGAGEFRHRAVPDRSGASMAAATGCLRHRIAGRYSLHHLRDVGIVRVRAVHVRASGPLARCSPGRFAANRNTFFRAAAGLGHAHRRNRAGNHGDSLHLLGDARSVPHRAGTPEGIRLRAGRDHLGSSLERRAAIHASGGDRRRIPGARPRVGRNHGGNVRARQFTRVDRIAADARQFDRGGHRQRIHRSGFRVVPFFADRARLPAVRGHLSGAGDRALDAAPARTQTWRDMSALLSPQESLYRRRRVRNAFALLLSGIATLFGLFWLVWILWTTLANGIGALSPALLTQMTPPPGESGGLANALFGSLFMSALAIAIGAPIGVFAGVWLAEYARCGRLGELVRFLNDILLSAPSIVLGLFVYAIVVKPSGHFSALA